MSDVLDFGAGGDGKTDDTEAILHAIRDGDGVVEFPRGDYVVTKTIPIEFAQVGRTSLHGAAGTAKIIMAGAGPAFHLVGTHNSSADPGGFKPGVWARERMPSVLNLEIEGRHPEADGLLVEGVMQPTFEGVLLRELRDAIRVMRRARNVLISHCHIYHNRRNGIFFDNCNLHQVVIASCHISYNAQAGIQMLGGQMRNIQITGNDIEYNYRDNVQESADVLVDCRPEGSTINEGTIASNTIQARQSVGGANVRVLGNEDNRDNSAGMLAITGNLIGSQDVGIHLRHCCATTVSGNMLYASARRNVLIEGSRNIVIGPNSIDHNTDWSEGRQLATGVRIEGSRDVSLTGLQIKDAPAGKHTLPGVKPTDRKGLVELVNCRRVTGSGLHLIDGAPAGIYVENSSDVLLTGCTVQEARDNPLAKSAIHWTGPGQGNALTASRLVGKLEIDPKAGVELVGNVEG